MRVIVFAAMIFFTALGIPASAQTAGSIRVALVQLDSSKAGDYAAMLSYAKSAKAQGANIIVFPETSDMGWLNPNVFYDAYPIPGLASDQFSTIAKEAGLWVAAGLAERGPKRSDKPITYEAFDSAILIDPAGSIVLHHRKYTVLKNAFSVCPVVFGSACAYTQGPLQDTKVASTPFGIVGLLVCADAYTYDPAPMNALKPYRPDLVIIPWGVASGKRSECGADGFNATLYAIQAAKYLGSAYVVGANATGSRKYGRFLPSWYCGTSGFATPEGRVGGTMNKTEAMAIFEIPRIKH